MIPLADTEPVRSSTPVTMSMVVACVGVFVFMSGLSDIALDRFIDRFALVPRRVDAQVSDLMEFGVTARGLWDLARPFVSSMFLHGGLAHLLGNMLFLWVFGRSVESRIGSIGFVLCLVFCGVVAGLVHTIDVLGEEPLGFASLLFPIEDAARVPTIGASGAIGGVLGAHFLLFPRSRILTFVPPLFLFPVPGWIFLGVWFFLESISATAGAHASEVAHWAHVGGFAAGMLCAVAAMTIAPRRVIGPEA
jgi:membrane associated rhomboid family serine protease